MTFRFRAVLIEDRSADRSRSDRQSRMEAHSSNKLRWNRLTLQLVWCAEGREIVESCRGCGVLISRAPVGNRLRTRR